MRCVGLDFETANGHPASICAVGAALVEQDATLDTRSWLVQLPHEIAWMSPFCQQVHGISLADLAGAPVFPEIWPELERFLHAGDLVVAHNAAFDIRCLRGSLAYHGLKTRNFPYADTLRLSRRILGKTLPNHRLNTVADAFGITFRHHDALEDAACCARILGRLLTLAEAQTFPGSWSGEESFLQPFIRNFLPETAWRPD